jgi:hypothetical protein
MCLAPNAIQAGSPSSSQRDLIVSSYFSQKHGSIVAAIVTSDFARSTGGVFLAKPADAIRPGAPPV